MTDVNGDKGYNEILTDGVNTNNDGKAGSVGEQKKEEEFLARSKRKSKASNSFLPV